MLLVLDHYSRFLSSSFQFLSLGLRETFEVARIKVVLQPCTTTSAPQIGRTVNMDKLKRDVENMGDSVSDEAKAFLTTLEKFQKVSYVLLGTVGDFFGHFFRGCRYSTILDYNDYDS